MLDEYLGGGHPRCGTNNSYDTETGLLGVFKEQIQGWIE